ncbi:hypothetical protein EON65_07725 [archaeon]|nr:MAG: hypothetical protein EON65_07725 [archaeon]
MELFEGFLECYYFSVFCISTYHYLFCKHTDNLPIIVGGSTMWLQWLVHGLPDAPKASAHAIQQAEHLLSPFQAMQQWDEAVAVVAQYDVQGRHAGLARNDWYRLKRCLEIALDLMSEGRGDGLASSHIQTSNAQDDMGSDAHIHTQPAHTPNTRLPTNTSHTIMLHNTRSPSPLSAYDVYCFFLIEDREVLYPTIDTRCMHMIHYGLLSEVGELLLSKRLLPNHMGARAIGYRQCIELFCSYPLHCSIPSSTTTSTSTSLPSPSSSSSPALIDSPPLTPSPASLSAFRTFLADFGTATRNYAKRQHNWYRKDKNFLFLNILRTATTKSKTSTPSLARQPYIHVAEEILSYLSQPHSVYAQDIERQLVGAQMYAEHVQNRKLTLDTQAKDDTSVAKCTGNDNQDKSMYGEVVQYILDERQGKKPAVVPGHTARSKCCCVPFYSLYCTHCYLYIYIRKLIYCTVMWLHIHTIG